MVLRLHLNGEPMKKSILVLLLLSLSTTLFSQTNSLEEFSQEVKQLIIAHSDKLDANEQILGSLTRELKEELGYEFHDVKVIPIEKFTSDNGHFSYHTFLIPIEDEFVPVLNYEHRGYCWVALEDHPKPLHPGVWRTINFTAVVEKIKTLEKVLL